MDVVETIRKALEDSPRSVQDIAEETGISRVHLSRFKHGHRGLGADMLVKLAPAVGVDLTAKRKRGAK